MRIPILIVMKKILSLIIGAICLYSCGSSYSSFYQTGPSIQYLNSQLDGSITVRVSASGRNYADALAQANKSAIKQVLFRGVNVPGNSLLSKPLITEVNAEEKYQSFFYAFFADGGEYEQFATSEDKRAGSNRSSNKKVAVRIVTTVRVLRADLKQYLLDNNVIKP